MPKGSITTARLKLAIELKWHCPITRLVWMPISVLSNCLSFKPFFISPKPKTKRRLLKCAQEEEQVEAITVSTVDWFGLK